MMNKIKIKYSRTTKIILSQIEYLLAIISDVNFSSAAYDCIHFFSHTND